MEPLRKWDVLRVLPPGVGHPKYAVCICPVRFLFFYINSAPSFGRKRRSACLVLPAYAATFLRKEESFLDTGDLVPLPGSVVETALADAAARVGSLAPSLRESTVALAARCGVLEPAELAIVVANETFVASQPP